MAKRILKYNYQFLQLSGLLCYNKSISYEFSHSVSYELLHWCQKDDTRVAFPVFCLMSRALALSGVITGCAVVRHGGTPTVATKGWSASSDPDTLPGRLILVFNYFYLFTNKHNDINKRTRNTDFFILVTTVTYFTDDFSYINKCNYNSNFFYVLFTNNFTISRHNYINKYTHNSNIFSHYYYDTTLYKYILRDNYITYTLVDSTPPPFAPTQKAFSRTINILSDIGTLRFSVPSSELFSVYDLITLVAKKIGLPADSFYLMSHTSPLRQHLPFSFYTSTVFSLHFKLLGGSSDDAVDVCAVAPTSTRPFFLDKDNKPDTWLSLVDFAFFGTKISPYSKAQVLLAALPTELLQSLGSDVMTIMTTKSIDCYSELCSLLKKFYLPSENSLFAEYFRTQQIGTLTPSQFLNKSRSDLQRLHPGLSADDTVVRKFFLSVLPDTTRAILAGSQLSSLDELAHLADRIGDTLPKPVSSVDVSLVSLVKDLADQVSSLRLEVANARSSRPTSRDTGFSPHRQRSKSVSRILCSEHFSNKDNTAKCYIGCTADNSTKCTIIPICVYHNVYKSRANRCLPGCTFSKNQ